MASKDRARIGMIGAGWWATFAHLPSLSTYPTAELIGIADTDLNKATGAAERFGVPRAFADHRALLDLKPDGVVIATPHHTHYELVRDALLAGCDVMVEKPMVVDPAHGRELVTLARERGRNIHLGYPFPFSRHAQALHASIQNGELGDVLFTTSLFTSSVLDFYRGQTAHAGESHAGAMWGPGTQTYSKPEFGGGQMLTQVTHAASLLFFLTRVRPTSVSAFTGTHDTKVDVWDAISYCTATGAAGTFSSTGTVSRSARAMHEIRIFGSAGHALLDPALGTLEIHFADGTIRQEPPLVDDELYLLHQTSRQLVDTILGRGPVVASGDLGLLTVEFLDAALTSAREGRVVEVPTP